MEIGNFKGGLETLKPQSVKRLVLSFSESDLLESMTAKMAHADIIASPLENEYL